MGWGYGYGAWRGTKGSEEAHEKAWSRKKLAEWDEKWHALSPKARFAFVDDVKGPPRDSSRTVDPNIPADRLEPEVLKELREAGFLRIEESRRPGKPDRVYAARGLYDFATRIRALKRYRLLTEASPKSLRTYVDFIFYSGQKDAVANEVLQAAGVVDQWIRIEDALDRYVATHYWPGWAVRKLKSEDAAKVVAAIQESGGSVPLVELLGKVPGVAPEKVRKAVDDLIARLALFEDLDPKTGDILVGLLPSVREGLEQASRPRARPELEACKTPKELGPEGSVVINDLRAFFMELVSEPPRLRQDRTLFQKEEDRFLAALEPLPDWFSTLLKWSPETRLNEAGVWAQRLRLTRDLVEGKEIRRHLSTQGEKWLAGDPAGQYESIYKYLRQLRKESGEYFLFDEDDDYDPGYSSIDYAPGDARFLGTHVVVKRKTKSDRKPPNPYYYDYSYDYVQAKPEDYLALRESLFRAFDELKPGVFYRVESLLGHAGFGPANPLFLGLDPGEVEIYLHARKIAKLEEECESAARGLLETLIESRLIPYGALRAARDDRGKLCVARTALLDAYFGRKGAKVELPGVSAGESKVVVQPDFSVVVIGLNPAPAAELAPFCERTTRNVGAGAIVLKLTRDAVVKAVGHGLAPAEIIARLERLASNGVPANVLHEVQGWCGWVRRVQPETLTVIRCADRETADRVVAALGKQAERVNDTLVAIPHGLLQAANRAKLQAHGIVVAKGGLDASPKPKAKTKARRRRRW